MEDWNMTSGYRRSGFSSGCLAAAAAAGENKLDRTQNRTILFWDLWSELLDCSCIRNVSVWDLLSWFDCHRPWLQRQRTGNSSPAAFGAGVSEAWGSPDFSEYPGFSGTGILWKTGIWMLWTNDRCALCRNHSILFHENAVRIKKENAFLLNMVWTEGVFFIQI